MELKLHGYRYSVYCWIVRAVLAEKALDYQWIEVDPFAGEKGNGRASPHPFGRVPFLEHGDFQLYETYAIETYFDEAFEPIGSLQPRDPQRRARMRQFIAIADSYAYWPLVRQVFAQRVFAPAAGELGDEGEVAAGLEKSRPLLSALEALTQEEGPFLLGQRLTLADLHLAPMLSYFAKAPEGADALGKHRRLSTWLARMQERPCFIETDPGLPGD